MVVVLHLQAKTTGAIGRAPALSDVVIRGETVSRKLPQEDTDFEWRLDLPHYPIVFVGNALA
jgi:hypothetical protein